MYGDGIADLPAHRVREGHYLRVLGRRQFTAEWIRPDEGFARVERVEALGDLARVVDHRREGEVPGKLVAVYCRGVPGVVVMGGTVQVRHLVEAARIEHDLATATWTHLPCDATLIPGARLVTGLAGPPVREEPWSAPPCPRRAAVFSRAAGLARAGEYIRVLPERDPPASGGVDEAFARVDAVEHLQGPSALDAGEGTSVILTLGGLHGVLVLGAVQELEVLVSPHAERAVMEERYPWNRGPYLSILGARPVTDPPGLAAYPPAPSGEQEQYRSIFRNPWDKELTLNGRHGIRAVPLAALPWPGLLHKCPHSPRQRPILARYPDPNDGSAAASAELFLELTPADFAACRPYHEPDWATIAAVAVEVAAKNPGRREGAELISADPRITAKDRRWAESLFADPLLWDERSEAMSGGRHRLCAMRAAGVGACPVEGRALPGAVWPAQLPASEHARRTVARYWAQLSPVPGWAAGAAAYLLARRPALLRYVKRKASS